MIGRRNQVPCHTATQHAIHERNVQVYTCAGAHVRTQNAKALASHVLLRSGVLKVKALRTRNTRVSRVIRP
jgi:hypothetical protein